MKKYETSLPQNYIKVGSIRFGDAPTGFLSDVNSVLPGIILLFAGWLWVKPAFLQILFSFLLFAAAIYPYFCLHELLHGLIYKCASIQNITIGFHRSGAYCAVPDLYLYRNVAVISTASPLTVFFLLFSVMEIGMIYFRNWGFLPFGMLLILHLLACRSDVHLLRELRKYKNNALLLRDNGTEQTLYLPKEMSGISR